MKKKTLLKTAIAVAAYLLLVLLLMGAERNAPGASITSFGNAVWYTLTTLTTVGYGDLYPVTAAGKLIGAVFQLLSVGLLALLVGVCVINMRGVLQKLRLRRLRKRPWYLFTEQNSASAALARQLKDEQPDSVVLFCGTRTCPGGGWPTALTPKEALSLKRGEKGAHVFCLSEDPLRNGAAARELEETPCDVYCMAVLEERAGSKEHVFDPWSGCARLYWQQFPIRSDSEKILLIGEGRYAEALLEKGLQHNVLSSKSHIRYTVFGDFENFRRDHPYLPQLFSMEEGSGRDSLLFAPQSWNTDPEILLSADRIILCYDAEGETWEVLTELNKYFPHTGEIHARLSFAPEGIRTFGSEEEIFSPEIVMRRKLDAGACALNAIYENSTKDAGGDPQEAWDRLSGFLKDSNRASADHLSLKTRILTGSAEPEMSGQAYERWRKAGEEERTEYRRIEHERWVRFHVLRGWQYAPERDNSKRLHPMILPYDELDRKEQLKDDYAWELLGKPVPDGKSSRPDCEDRHEK